MQVCPLHLQLAWSQELQTSTILHSSCNAELQQTLLVIKPRREKGIAMLQLAKGLHFLPYFKQHTLTFTCMGQNSHAFAPYSPNGLIR